MKKQQKARARRVASSRKVEQPDRVLAELEGTLRGIIHDIRATRGASAATGDRAAMASSELEGTLRGIIHDIRATRGASAATGDRAAAMACIRAARERCKIIEQRLVLGVIAQGETR
jgi:hypothetical protein